MKKKLTHFLYLLLFPFLLLSGVAGNSSSSGSQPRKLRYATFGEDQVPKGSRGIVDTKGIGVSTVPAVKTTAPIKSPSTTPTSTTSTPPITSTTGSPSILSVADPEKAAREGLRMSLVQLQKLLLILAGITFAFIVFYSVYYIYILKKSYDGKELVVE